MLLEWLQYLEANPAAYRLVVGLIVTIIVNVFGFLANLARNKEIKYDKGMFAETLMVYEPLILLLPEAMPMKWAIVGAIVADVWRRTYKAFSATKT